MNTQGDLIIIRLPFNLLYMSMYNIVQQHHQEQVSPVMTALGCKIGSSWSKL